MAAGLRWLWRLALLAALIIGWFMALEPGTGKSAWFPHADKLQHAIAFAAYWCVGVLAGVRPRVLLALGLLGFGIAIEWAQSMIPGREASWADVVADAVGIGLGAMIQHWVLKRLGA